MEQYEYLGLKLDQIPADIIKEYALEAKVRRDGYVYIEARKGMYGLPQAGLLAHQLLEKRLEKHGYTQSKQTLGLWKHEQGAICFSLVVDDFGVKYVGEAHANHLIRALKEDYDISEDWKGLNRISGKVTYMRPLKLQASLRAHVIMRKYELVDVGHCFGKVRSWLQCQVNFIQGRLSGHRMPID